MRSPRVLIAVAGVIIVAACGGSPSGPSGGQNSVTVTITASGVAPNPITVAPGGRVLFVNSDTRAHDIEWDPHPDHQGPCTAAGVNQPGFLAAGERRETGNFVNVQSCGYHDHSDPPPGGARWAGTIVVR